LSLLKVIPGLLTHELDGQLVAYDSRGDRVHLLDATTGRILNLIREKELPVEQIAIEVGARTGAPVSRDIVAVAIDELRKADLLADDVAPAVALSEVSRREAVRRIAAAGIAAALVPAVVSLTPSVASAQASPCSQLKVPDGCPCNGNGNCESSHCVAGTCVA
jgi:hypothetical protein